MTAPDSDEVIFPSLLDVTCEDDARWDHDEDYSWLMDGNPALSAFENPYWGTQPLEEEEDNDDPQQQEETSHAVDDHFTHHEHYLFSCDGNGSYMIASLWYENGLNHHHNNRRMATLLILRCHEDVRESLLLPIPFLGDDDDDDDDASRLWFRAFLAERRNECGLDYRNVSYETCATLVEECLRRMRDHRRRRRRRRLPDAEAVAVVRLYRFDSTSSTTMEDRSDGDARLTLASSQLPEPRPAPRVEDLWWLLQRPEYHAFYANHDLFHHVVVECDRSCRPNTAVTEDDFHGALRYLASDDVDRRERLHAMLRHMALYHAVAGETDVASWLLWERAVVMERPVANDDDEDADTVFASAGVERSVLCRLLVHEFLSWRTDEHTGRRPSKFPHHGPWGEAITRYISRRDDACRRRENILPPRFVVSSPVRTRRTESVESDKTTVAAAKMQCHHHSNRSQSPERVREVFWTTRPARGGCAICGATTGRGGGTPLLRSCSRCLSAVYCSREHQKMHWKRGGHRHECAARDPPSSEKRC